MSEMPIEPANTTAEPDWLEQPDCPSCGGSGREIGPLFKQEFRLGSAEATPPPAPIKLRTCRDCGLVFKSIIASPALLTRMTSQAHGGLWTQPYAYADELAAIRAIDAEALTDVIDIGAAGGLFLDRMPEGARKSALDIVRFDTLQINGEFIEGFLDDEQLEWSGEPYRLVGLFDVAEHLYNPVQAFRNLRSLCREGGLVVIETGNSESVRTSQLPNWYYLNLVEHHIAWNKPALEDILSRTGFEVVEFTRKKHKNHRPMPLKHRAKEKFFGLAPRLMQAIWKLAGRSLDVPATDKADHMRFILRAV